MGKSQAKKEEQKARETRLQQAILHDHVDELYKLIVEEPEPLDRVSKHPFPNTPLHLAAAHGSTQVVMEMAILKPSFTRKLNPEGFSPMHLALQYKHYHIVRALMTFDPKLVRVRGRSGITPLHFVAKRQGNDELELLAEFLCACKSSIEDLTSQYDTAVHVAIKNHNIQAFKVLFGWLERVYLTEILDWKDKDGNTVLHIAKSYDEEDEELKEIVKMLEWYVKVNATNFQGKTASQVKHDSYEDIEENSKTYAGNLSLSKYLSSKATILEKYANWLGIQNESARHMILLVAALTATATYEAALTIPEEYRKNDSSNPLANSLVVTANYSSFKLYFFTFLNSGVFLASIMTIWMTAITLLPHTIMVYGSTVSVGCAYLATLMMGFPNSDVVGWRLVSVFYVILLLVVVLVPAISWFKHEMNRQRIDAAWRRVGSSLPLNDQL